ncbi:hypothetical protein EDB80DRAFT_455540 [Ilyonectria destructans]|nr:hypothetical protein EDB80DRAFT_455540 [Ilyonectria destructans]
MGRQPRKRQISCHFCRARKLRCNREFPCSNCTSRGVPCPEPQHAASPAAQRPSAKKAASKAGETDIQSRLERLEGLLHGLSKHLEALPEQAQPTAVAPFEPLAPQLPLPLKVQSLTNDALRLEASCMVTKTRLLLLRQRRLSRVPHSLNHAPFIIHLSRLIIRAHAMYLAAQPRRGGGIG